MFKKTVRYTNFNGDDVTEDHYFHLSKAELVEMQYSVEGGLAKYLEQIVESEEGKTIMETFKTLLLDAYGKKSEDGARFIKNPQIREEFASSEAYSVIFMELATNADAAAAFINGIVPDGLEQDVEQLRKDADKPNLAEAPKLPKGFEPPKEYPKPDGLEEEEAPQPLGVKAATQRIITMAEAQAMPQEELQRLLASGEARLASTEG